jgi:hypothetical protein
MKLLTETYGDKIAFVLSCYDRLVFTGSMPEISHCQGMTSYLYKNNVKIFDYPKFAEPFKEAIRANAEHIAKEHGVEIEFIRKSGVRKESIISEKIEQRGNHPGIVHIISAMETCNTYKP